MADRLLLIGVGNRDRGDDAVGPLVVDLVRGNRPAGADRPDQRPDRSAGPIDAIDAIDAMVVEGSTLDLAVWWRPTDRVVLVDASEPRGAPGRIVEVDAVAASLPAAPAWSTHGIDVAAAIAIARAIGRLPRALTVIAVEGRSFEIGAPVSDAVVDAAVTVARRVRALAAVRAPTDER